jgi:hypothetical protein
MGSQDLGPPAIRRHSPPGVDLAVVSEESGTMSALLPNQPVDERRLPRSLRGLHPNNVFYYFCPGRKRIAMNFDAD